MCKLLEYGKVDVWVFYKIRFGLFLVFFQESQRCLFLDYFKLRINLLASLQFLPPSACSHPDELSSEDQVTGCEVRAGSDLLAFPSGLPPPPPRAGAVGGAGGVPMKSGPVLGCLPAACHRSPPHPLPLQPKSQCPASVEHVPPGPLSLGKAVRLGFLARPFPSPGTTPNRTLLSRWGRLGRSPR